MNIAYVHKNQIQAKNKSMGECERERDSQSQRGIK